MKRRGIRPTIVQRILSVFGTGIIVGGLLGVMSTSKHIQRLLKLADDLDEELRNVKLKNKEVDIREIARKAPISFQMRDSLRSFGYYSQKKPQNIDNNNNSSNK